MTFLSAAFLLLACAAVTPPALIGIAFQDHLLCHGGLFFDPSEEAVVGGPQVRHPLLLGVPSMFDGVLVVAGLIHVAASMCILLRGGGWIAFATLMKQHLARRLLTLRGPSKSDLSSIVRTASSVMHVAAWMWMWMLLHVFVALAMRHVLRGDIEPHTWVRVTVIAAVAAGMASRRATPGLRRVRRAIGARLRSGATRCEALLCWCLAVGRAAASGSFSTVDTTAAGVDADGKYSGAAAVGTMVYFAPYNEDNVGVLTLPSPPPSAPLPQPPQPTPSPSSAGDDPTFIGADKIPYDVRGEPWRYFNLVSAPRLSLNAQFLPVPDRFVHGKITDTVLGTLHLATCNAATRHTLGVLFDVFDGTLQCTLRTAPGSLATPVPCDAELAAAGVTVRRELSGCRLSTMECGINPEEQIAAIEADDASFVRVHLERLNISLASGARLSFVRDLIERPGAAFVAQFDCSRLKSWPRAVRACEVTQAYARGEATLADWQALSRNERTALFAFFTAGNRSKQLHFHNAHIDSLAPYAQHEVHGLLGQRAISPAPMKQPPIEQLGGGAKEQSEFAAQATTTIAAALGLGGGGVGTSTTIRATVQADGHLQGEGAIEGSYRDYQVKWVSSHGPGAFAFSRFTECMDDGRQ